MTAWWLVEYRQFSDCSANVRSRVGTRGASTMSTVPFANR